MYGSTFNTQYLQYITKLGKFGEFDFLDKEAMYAHFAQNPLFSDLKLFRKINFGKV